MRRKSDPFVLVCTAISLLCALVVVLVVAPTVLKTSSDTSDVKTDAQRLETATQRLEAATERTQTATKMNCDRIHQLVVTLDQLIASGRKQARAYRRDGTITPKQLKRALRENSKSRRKLGEADCPPRRPS